MFITFTSTNAQSQIGTFTSIIVTGIPVVIVNGPVGLTRNDKIALGVGLGLGIPFLAAVMVFCYSKFTRPSPALSQYPPPSPPGGEQYGGRYTPYPPPPPPTVVGQYRG